LLGSSGDELVATVDGSPVRVRAPGHRLIDRPEAWATAFSIPAARAGASLRLPAPVDAGWRAGMAANVSQMAAWWGGADHLSIRSDRPSARAWLRRRTRTGHGRSADAVPPPGRALCFTGGVDSFYSLLTGDHRPTHLLFVHGFDLALDDADRRAAAGAAVRATAEAHGLTPIEVETDLRDHPRFASVSWEHTHGAALAAIAMLLGDELSALIVPPSYMTGRLIPWGSRPDTDPRWSIPGRFAVEHGDPSLRRRERLRLIASDPLVRAHLRVCWAHLQPGLNCGECEKCVRTQIDLEHVGAREQVTTFPSDRDLPELIDAMAPLPPTIQPMWHDLRALPLRAEVVAAIGRALSRSEG
jgi:hypothetical protein